MTCVTDFVIKKTSREGTLWKYRQHNLKLTIDFFFDGVSTGKNQLISNYFWLPQTFPKIAQNVFSVLAESNQQHSFRRFEMIDQNLLVRSAPMADEIFFLELENWTNRFFVHYDSGTVANLINNLRL